MPVVLDWSQAHTITKHSCGCRCCWCYAAALRFVPSRIAPLLLALLLSACGTVPTQPADPAVVARIVQICLNSGLFKLAGDGISLIPGAALPVQVIDAGIDKVCANPAAFAADVSTVQWLVKNLAAVAQRKAAMRRGILRQS